MEFIQNILTQMHGLMGYGVFFVMVASCSLGAPFNSDFLFLVASLLAASGHFQLPLIMVTGFFALMTGDSINFFTARKYGKKILLKRPFVWFCKKSKVEWAENYLKTKGAWFLFVIRFLPFIRTVLFFTVGTLQVSPKRFYLANIVSTLVYIPVLTTTVYRLSQNSEQIWILIKQFQIFLAIGVFLILFSIPVFQKWTKRKVH